MHHRAKKNGSKDREYNSESSRCPKWRIGQSNGEPYGQCRIIEIRDHLSRISIILQKSGVQAFSRFAAYSNSNRAREYRGACVVQVSANKTSSSRAAASYFRQVQLSSAWAHRSCRAIDKCPGGWLLSLTLGLALGSLLTYRLSSTFPLTALLVSSEAVVHT